MCSYRALNGLKRLLASLIKPMMSTVRMIEATNKEIM